MNKRTTILFCLLVALTTQLWGQTVVGTLSHPGLEPKSIAVYEAGNKVFVADDNTGNLYMYDGATNAELGSVFVGAGVAHMAVHESSGKLYAASNGAQKIAVVNAATGAFITYLAGTYSNFPRLEVDQSLGKVYALSLQGLTQIDVATNSETTVPGFGGGGFEEMALNPVTHELFVTRYNADVLEIIDGVTLAKTTVAGLGGVAIGVNPTENKVYISRGGGGGVPFEIYDRDTGAINNVFADNDVSAFPFIHNPASNRMYTSSEVNAISTILEGATDAFFNLPMFSATSALAVRPATNHVYYACKQFIGVLDDPTQLLEMIPVSNPSPSSIIVQAVAINQTTGRVYVINDGNALNFVTVVQDAELMTRPLVHLGSVGFPGKVHVMDPLTRQIVEARWTSPSFQDDHATAARPGGGRLYLPQVSGFTEELHLYAGVGNKSLLTKFGVGGNDSRAVAFKPDGSRFYVTNSASDNVSVMDAANNSLITTIAAGDAPWGIAVSPDGAKAYVANNGSGVGGNSVSVISTATNTESKKISVGTAPYGVAINPAGTKLFVANSGAGTVSVIDLISETVSTTVTVGTTPHWLSCTADGKRVYVGNRASGTVWVIDAGTNAVIQTLTGFTNPEGIGVMPDNSEVFVVNSSTGTSSISVINNTDFSTSNFTLPADAKETISLTIEDPTSKFAGRVTSGGTPISGTLVRALQSGVEKGTATANASGDYAIFNLKSGTYDIEASASGYVTQTQSGQSVGIGRTTILNFNLTSSAQSGVTIVESSGSTNVTEGGATDTYTVVLNTVPSADVTIMLNTGSQLESISPITFTPANALTPQTVTVTAVNDQVVEGNHTGTISHTATSSDANYNGISIASVTANITDNDVAGVTIAESGGSTNVTEGGATDTYTVVLNTVPSANVTISFNTGNQLESISPITFTPANALTPQTVTVTAVNDAIAEGNHTGMISHSATSSDANYNGISIASVTANITDNDVAGVTIAESGGSTNVAEGGATDTYTVVLNTVPSADVTIMLNAGSQLESISPITFTPANALTPQTVTVTAVNDAIAEGNHTGTISHSATSSDANYNGISIASVTADITDNDMAGVTIVESGGSTNVAEGGATDTYTVVLNTVPSADVTISFNTGSQLESISPITFTPANALTPQTVTVTAVNDAIAEGNHTGTISHSATSSDANYNGISIASVTADITDNDMAGVTIVESGGSTNVAEGGATDTYTVVLNTVPSADVTISFNTGSQLEPINAIIFTPANALTPQAVTVTAVDDATAEGNHTGTISHSATSSDANYNDISIANVTANITDNDGSAPWTPLSIPTTETMRSVHFVNANKGWAVGYNGKIIHTADGGATWDTQTSGTTERFLAVRFIDENCGWAGAGRFIVRTTDGGANWVSVGADPSALIFRNSLFPVSCTQAWAPASGGGTRWFYRYTVQDGGSVSEQSYDVIGSTVQFNDLYFVDPDNGWAVGTSGQIRRISNASSASPGFSPQPSGTTASLNGIHMLDANNGWIAGNAGTILKTTNGGAGWAAQNSGTSTNLRDVHFVDLNNGWVVGESGLILATTDGGATWTPQNSGVSTTLWSVFFINPGYVAGGDLAGGNNGVILKTLQGGVGVAGVTIVESGGSTNVAEGGVTDTYTVVLNTVPSADVMIAFNTGSQLESISPITFTPANALTPQTITVTAVNDAIAEGNHTGTISHAATSSDANYNGISIANVTANITDNDVAGVTIVESSGSTNVAEGGATDTYTVVLNTVPSADVTISFNTGSQLEPISPITFTPANALTPQTITVTAVNDQVVEGNHTGTISHSATSSDANYNDISIANVTANITDNDVAGVTIVESSGSTNVAEGGATDTYTVVLNTVPSANVTISFNTGSQLEAISPITFTPANALTPQTITVTAVNDAIAEGNHTGTISHSATSSDANYNGISIASVTANITDNDVAGVTIVESGGSTNVAEGGTTDTYTVVLNTVPSANVTISFNTGSQLEAISAITFTPANALTPQTITVTAVNDQVVEGNHTGTISHSATSSDANYNGISIASVTANITDNDVAGVTIVESGGSTNVTEGGGTDTYTIVLNTVPAADVTITLNTGSQLHPMSPITFTPANALTPQTVTVTAVDDQVVESNHSFTISHSATSSDPNYNGIPIREVPVNITDNDVAGVAVVESGGSTNVVEDGTTDTYTVVLNTVPSANVTISFNTGSQLQAINPITFTPANALTPQTITVTAVNDQVVEGNHTGTISHSASSSDANYNGIGITSVTANITDNDVAGVTIVESGGSTNVAEGGATDTYTVVLNTVPSADVTISFNTGSQLQSISSITFTPANALTPQTITVTAVNDQVVEGNHTGTISHAATSSDANYNVISIASVTANITDNDVAGVTIVESGGSTNVAEGGATDTYTVVLNTVPSANVTISFNTGSQLQSISSITFTPANALTPQTVTVTAVNDQVVEGNHTGTISHSATSSDANYNGISIANVTANITDNDVAGVTIVESGGSTNVAEGGATDTYTVVLNTMPSADVTISFNTGSQLEPISPITFTPANALTPQTITVTAVNDAIAEGNHTGTISHAATSSDANYNGISIASVTANITDNDVAGVTIVESGGSTNVAEGGATDTYTVVLNTVPSADVTIAFNTGNQLQPINSINFTPANALTPQTITVTAVNDQVVEGNHTGTISHAATSSDANYNGISIASVTANITDNDVAGVTIVESSGSTNVAEGGATDTYTVVLNTVPSADVTIAFNTGSQLQAISLITFTPANALTPQTITVTAVDDQVAEGNHTGTISHSATSSDANYNGIGIANVTANITDNDGVSPITLYPTDDAYVNSNQPTTNFGTATTLRMRQSTNILHSYLKFVVSGVTGQVLSAKLRMKVTAASNSGGSIYFVANNSWTEASVNYNNAPTISGTPLSTVGSVTVDEVVEFDVTTAISGNGTFSFGLNNSSTTTVQYSSKEGATPPELVLQIGPPPPPPEIVSFTPPEGTIGTVVTISGDNFTGATQVAFNGVAAIFTVNSNTQITATVPDGATTGPISVTTPGGTATSATNFTVTGPPPTLVFNPTDDAYVNSSQPTTNFGTATTLRMRQAATILHSYLKFVVSGVNGQVLSAKLRMKVTAASNSGGSIYFVANNSWTEASVNYNNAPTISGTPLSTVGSVTVDEVVEFDVTMAISGNGTFSFGLNNSSTTTVQYSSKEGATPPELVLQIGPPPPPPEIVSFTPPEGTIGTVVTISGDNFTGATQIAFNGVAAIFTVNSNTQITATVPDGATTGPISVTTPGGTATSATNFTVTGPPPTLVFNPTDDAYVNPSQPTTNFGTATTLRMRQAATILHSYLKFVVSGVNGQVLSAKLRMKVTVASNSGGSVYSVSNNYLGTSNPWLETGLNYNNAPTISGTALDTKGSVTVSQVVEFNVTQAITGNGTFSLGLNNSSTTAVQYSSKEGATPPELILQIGPPPPPPEIVSFTPPNGTIGTVVTINGDNFTGATQVAFNGVAANFTVNSNTQITATVPDGATTGPISVTTLGGTATSATNFTVTGPPPTLVFNPTDDAYVNSNQVTTNFGTATTLRMRQSTNILHSYLKFVVSGVTGQVLNAKLRMKVTVASNSGGSVYSVSNDYQGTSNPWLETGLNYNNAPTISGTPLSSVGSVTVDEVVEFDVTAAISGNGTFSFGLNNSSTTTVQYSSKEGATMPELVIQYNPTIAAKMVDRPANAAQMENAAALPETFSLAPNYPNPFNPSTNLRFGLPQEAQVTLKIYNMLGEEVATLVNERRRPGFYTVVFAAANLPSGVYFSVLNAGEIRLVRRMVLIR